MLDCGNCWTSTSEDLLCIYKIPSCIHEPMLRSPSSRSALSASKGLKGLLLDVRTNAEHLWASTKKTGSSPELLAEPLFAQQEVRTTGRCECNWYFSVPVTPHEFSRVASDVGVLATGPAPGIGSSNL